MIFRPKMLSGCNFGSQQKISFSALTYFLLLVTEKRSIWFTVKSNIPSKTDQVKPQPLLRSSLFAFEKSASRTYSVTSSPENGPLLKPSIDQGQILRNKGSPGLTMDARPKIRNHMDDILEARGFYRWVTAFMATWAEDS